jgi:hypothetical protein
MRDSFGALHDHQYRRWLFSDAALPHRQVVPWGQKGASSRQPLS